MRGRFTYHLHWQCTWILVELWSEPEIYAVTETDIPALPDYIDVKGSVLIPIIRQCGMISTYPSGPLVAIVGRPTFLSVYKRNVPLAKTCVFRIVGGGRGCEGDRGCRDWVTGAGGECRDGKKEKGEDHHDCGR
jgi:hypothetical protein